MLRLLYVLALAYAVSACGGDAQTADNHDHDHAGHEHHDHDHDHGDHDHAGHDHDAPDANATKFGAEITTDGGIGAEAVIAQVEAGEGTTDLALGEGNMVQAIPAKLEGTVSEVCVKAGCWLKVAAGEQGEIFISTDHKFFVPKDIVGKTVVVDGHAYKTEMSVEELRHYAEDEGQTPEQIAEITEPENSYTLLARGVVIKQ